MPELPEVETTRRGLAPHVVGQTIERVLVREARLRWPIEPTLPRQLKNRVVEALERRAKYLLFRFEHGTVISHLGMSGSWRVITDVANNEQPYRLHDHLAITLGSGDELRYHDPRRFGCFLFTKTPDSHPLLTELGPEPLGDQFDGDYLFALSRGRKAPIKSFLMDNHVVVGVGNIYAQEALFQAGIHPLRQAGRVSRERYLVLADVVREILGYAITRGGTTLRDFLNSDGEPGYFAQELNVYGRAGERCHACGSVIKEARLSNRTTGYCPQCQT